MLSDLQVSWGFRNLPNLYVRGLWKLLNIALKKIKSNHRFNNFLSLQNNSSDLDLDFMQHHVLVSSGRAAWSAVHAVRIGARSRRVSIDSVSEFTRLIKSVLFQRAHARTRWERREGCFYWVHTDSIWSCLHRKYAHCGSEAPCTSSEKQQ